MDNIINGGGVFDNIVGQFSLKGTSIFTLGNFSILSNFNKKTDKQYSINVFNKPLTLNNINYNPLTNPYNLSINFDFSNLTNFAFYGSLTERFRVAVNNILTDFPASIFVSNNRGTISTTQTIFNLTLNNNNTTTFTVPVSLLSNPFDIEFSSAGDFLTDIDKLRNLSLNFTLFSIKISDNEYSIVDFIGTDDLINGDLTITIKGQPFSSNTLSYHIIPSFDERSKRINSFYELEKYLINNDSNPIYTSYYDVPVLDENNNSILSKKSITWVTTDGYNPSISNFYLESLLSDLVEIGDAIDNYKTNIIARMLVATPLLEYDTTDERFKKILQIYGRSFDDVKKFIDGLVYINKVTYDKKNNVSDNLIKNFADTLGWKTFYFLDEKDFLDVIFGKQDNVKLLGSNDTKLSPGEIDIELWRRLVINSAFLFKSKGTRNAIEFLLEFIGAPNSLYEINEYIYLANQKLNINELEQRLTLNNSTLTVDDLPVDDDGYPKIPVNNENIYFQSRGGWITNENNSNFDFGNEYIKQFETFPDIGDGFILQRIIDNKKTWVNSGKTDTLRYHDLTNSETKYSLDNDSLVLNVKNLSIYLKSSKYIQNTVNDFYTSYNFSGYSGSTNFISELENNNLSFFNFLNKIKEEYINVKNRKTTFSEEGNSYPKLLKVYVDYKNTVDKPISYQVINKYISYINHFWIRLIEQFIPATSILIAGTSYDNMEFNRQKFNYKHGIDDGSEFKEYYKEVTLGDTPIIKYSGIKNDEFKNETQCFLKENSFYLNYNTVKSYNLGSFSIPLPFNNGDNYLLSTPINGINVFRGFIYYNAVKPNTNDLYTIYSDFPLSRSFAPQCLVVQNNCSELLNHPDYCSENSNIIRYIDSIDEIDFNGDNSPEIAFVFSDISKININDIISIQIIENNWVTKHIDLKVTNILQHNNLYYVGLQYSNGIYFKRTDLIAPAVRYIETNGRFIKTRQCSIFNDLNILDKTVLFGKLSSGSPCLNIVNLRPFGGYLYKENYENVLRTDILYLINSRLKSFVKNPDISIEILTKDNNFIGSLILTKTNLNWVFSGNEIKTIIDQNKNIFEQTVTLRVKSNCDNTFIDLKIKYKYFVCYDGYSGTNPNPDLSTGTVL